jgi:hypothetical protein
MAETPTQHCNVSPLLTGTPPCNLHRRGNQHKDQHRLLHRKRSLRIISRSDRNHHLTLALVFYHSCFYRNLQLLCVLKFPKFAAVIAPFMPASPTAQTIQAANTLKPTSHSLSASALTSLFLVVSLHEPRQRYQPPFPYKYHRQH